MGDQLKEPTTNSESERPLIGVTTSEVRQADSVTPTPRGEPSRIEMALGLTYLRAIEKAGGIPVVIPPLHEDALEALIDHLDGICLSGGPDLDPETYGAREHPQLGPTEPALDRMELALAARADAEQVPILAICRGTQALNIVRGGTLHQHIPELSGKIEHRQSTPGDEPSHPVSLEKGSRLASILGDGLTEVNSFHHQSIDLLGRGLVPTAFAPDGIIEAIEDPSRAYLVGVQWHAETLCERPEEIRLFESFIEAARDEHERAHGHSNRHGHPRSTSAA